MKHRLFVLLLLVAAAVALPAPANAAACTGTSGVTVVVDYDNGTTRVGCAPGDPSSGYDALTKAGFAYTLASGNGAGAICSIDRVPDRSCPVMPPADAYWAYFHAPRGGSWSYSSTGGGGYDPKPGSVEGWRYRGSPAKQPRVAPPAPSAPKPSPKPTPKPSQEPSQKPSQKPTDAPTPTAGGSVTASPTTSPTSSPTATTPTKAAAPTTSSTTSGPEAATVTDAETPLAEPDDAGGASWVWGVAVVAALGAVAGGLVLRRRRG